MKAKFQDPRIVQKVLEMVATYYKTTSDTLKSVNGDSMAKKVVMYTLKEGLGASLKATLEAVGKKYPTDVYQAVKKVKALAITDPALASMIEEIKTEALIIATTPGGNTSAPPRLTTPQRQQEPRNQETSVIPVNLKKTQIIPSSNTAPVIAKVQKAVTGVFLSVDLLQSRDPASEVLLAKEAVVFLVWNDFPTIPHSKIIEAFHLDQDGFHRAIGRISVCLREDGNELKKKLEMVRKAYQ